MENHDDGIFPRLWHLAPPPNTNDDMERSLAQGGITVEGDLEQLNGDSARQPFHSPTSGWRLSAPASWAELLAACSWAWSRPSAMFGLSPVHLALRRVWNHRTQCSRMSSTSLRSTPFSSLTYAELRSRFPSRFIVFRCV